MGAFTILPTIERKRSPQIVGCCIQSQALSMALYDLVNGVGVHRLIGKFFGILIHGREYPARFQSCSTYPAIKVNLHRLPENNFPCAVVLARDLENPLILRCDILQILKSKGGDLSSAQSAAISHSQHSPIPQSPQRVIGIIHQIRSLPLS